MRGSIKLIPSPRPASPRNRTSFNGAVRTLASTKDILSKYTPRKPHFLNFKDPSSQQGSAFYAIGNSQPHLNINYKRFINVGLRWMSDVPSALLFENHGQAVVRKVTDYDNFWLLKKDAEEWQGLPMYVDFTLATDDFIFFGPLLQSLFYGRLFRFEEGGEPGLYSLTKFVHPRLAPTRRTTLPPATTE